MPRSRAFFAFALVAGLAACDAETPLETAAPVEDGISELIAGGSGGADPRSGGGGSLFDRLATEIPGFGGLYRSGSCAVVVVLTDLSRADHAIRLVEAALAPLTAGACPTGVRVNAERGQFTYLELQRYLQASRPLLEIDGVIDTRVDYKLNRLVIVVTSHAAAARATEMLPGLGIPQEAVAFESGTARPDRTRQGSPTRQGTTPTPTRRG